MRILFVHAHFDDFEFTAAGTFLLWKRKLGENLRARVLICNDGASGHQFRTRKQTARMRLKEQKQSLEIGGFEFELLRLPDGTVPRCAAMQVDVPLLAALWKSIREFEPDYLFCPPIPIDPLAGIHIDHEAVANAVRKVAYLINVPHAFTPEYPADETRSKPCKLPVVLTVYDNYMLGRQFDIAVDIEPVFPKVAEMAYCHQSQVVEWLPWVTGKNDPPCNLADWTRQLRQRFALKNKRLGLKTSRPVEVFQLTSWASAPDRERVRRDFPAQPRRK